MEPRFVSVVLLLVVWLSSSQACIKGYLENVDFPGSDVAEMYAPTLEFCQELCTQHPSCLFFSFNRADKSSGRFRCYLKASSTGHPQAQILQWGVSSGYSLKGCNTEPTICFSQVFEDMEFHGGDYRTFFTVNYEECQRVCTLEPVCQLFSFIKANFSSPDVRYKCHLKFSWFVPSPAAIALKAGVVSGFSQKLLLSQQFDSVCRSHFFSDIDFRGNDFLELQAVSPEHCQFLCSIHPLCTYFSFRSDEFRCFLKNNPNSMVAKPKSNFTSGISPQLCQIDESWAKLTYEDMEFLGSDYSSEVVPSVENCQDKCTEDRDCQFYTFHNGSFFHPEHQHRCNMKRVVTMPMPSQVRKVVDVISGFSLKNCKSP
ncbi:plasma kallikrein-like [Poeciliopsis prolifica]|uniref:plasma kallikrein-like n=1 Tax=Poeciliopsis prolifica TaxID=188132 RepID=UPI0024142FFD|nr:plasma kallikrein-like [Poeciliopsis prolifica]